MTTAVIGTGTLGEADSRGRLGGPQIPLESAGWRTRGGRGIVAAFPPNGLPEAAARPLRVGFFR